MIIECFIINDEDYFNSLICPYQVMEDIDVSFIIMGNVATNLDIIDCHYLEDIIMLEEGENIQIKSCEFKIN